MNNPMLRTLYQYSDLLRQQNRLKTANLDQAMGARGEDFGASVSPECRLDCSCAQLSHGVGCGRNRLGWLGARDPRLCRVKSRHTNEYGAPERAISPENSKA
jgi:hypothetical protein